MVVKHYGKILSSSVRGWLWWPLHEIRSRVLKCHCRLRQQCQGEVIVKAFPEAMSEEEQRGETLPRLDGVSLCEVGRGIDGTRIAALRAGEEGASDTPRSLCRMVI